jgi:outer membrane protein TolC
MKNKKLLSFSLLLFCVAELFSQTTGNELTLSLKDAQEMAVKNNISVNSARLDQKAAKLSIIETISAGLPQVNLTGSFTDNLKLMTTLLPGDFFGKPGEKVPVTFGSQYNSSGSIQASMLIFNAPYLIGIESSKLALKLSDQNLEQSELETKESVANTYYLILIGERSLDIIDGNLKNLNETLKATKSMLAAGMAEATDVDQMNSNVTAVENSRSSMERTIELNYNILRLELGVEATINIKLTESLDGLMTMVNAEALLSQGFNLKQNINYRIIESAEHLNMLNLKAKKASVLPTLAGFYDYGINGMGDKVNSQAWFKNSMTGLQLSFPIFGSGQRYIGIKKAQLNLERARLVKDLVSNQLSLQEKQLRYNLVSANLNYKSQKDNVEVSKRVISSMENKYKQGMASSLELTQANSLYLQAENNYISSLMNLLQTKLALDKLMNNM